MTTETEPCPTCMQPVPVPQRGDHDYGLPLRPMSDPVETAQPLTDLRAAAQNLYDHILGGMESRTHLPGDLCVGQLGIALATPPQPTVEALDVERLARAMHAGSHHYRGGVDDELARSACTQFGWEKSRCLAAARALGDRYVRLDPRHGRRGTADV